jgi:hypothetical protein
MMSQSIDAAKAVQEATRSMADGAAKLLAEQRKKIEQQSSWGGAGFNPSSNYFSELKRKKVGMIATRLG